MNHCQYVVITVIANEEEYEVTGKCKPAIPGKIHGNVESCYPPEPPEAEIESVTRNGRKVDLKKFLAMNEVSEEDIQEKMIEAAADASTCDEGPDPDDWYDDRHDREADREFNEKYGDDY